jgi:hypothetical protein
VDIKAIPELLGLKCEEKTMKRNQVTLLAHHHRTSLKRIPDVLFATLSFALWLAFVALLYWGHPA